MTAPTVTLRRLLPEDAESYREMRLEGLSNSPDAFGSTLEIEQAEPLERFANRLSHSAVFGAFRGARLVGVAGFYVEPGPKHAHKGVLWGMYVRPEARGAGVGLKLVEAVLDHARQHVEQIQLRVVSDNRAARRLYEKVGFVEYGLEKRAAKYKGRYHDDVLMALPLIAATTEALPA
ncbi:MAG TPA: GNAT family N-acetyltransferase [Stellaceae bacterium]|nr:GNAT family N-acetyltransferase [Stellaceae bacterium]